MKHAFIAGSLVGMVLVLLGCTCNPGPNGLQLSMKGYELYSWPAGQDWDFALMLGTNRLKTLDEIKSPQQILHGLDAVKTALRALPAGEEVFWEGENWIRIAEAPAGSISLPPAATRSEVVGLCTQLGIRLTVDE